MDGNIQAEAQIESMRNSVIRTAIGPTILLGSGTYFDFEDPEGSEITIEDVAYGLAFEGRCAGQCFSRLLQRRVFYSVAQHCVLMSLMVPPELRLQALMHEVGEAVCGDMTAPLKSLNPSFKAIEKRCEAAILNRFGITITDPVALKRADIRMLATERRDLLLWRGEKWSLTDIEPYDFHITPWTPEQAAEAFLNRYTELTSSPPPASISRGVSEDLRKRIMFAIFDPGASEGFKGDRDLTTWQTDAVVKMLNETLGGTGDDCSHGKGGVWPPQSGASSSRGNDSLSVVTAGETATPPLTNVPCPCTLIEQDEDCPVGYPSMICGICEGKGHTTQERVTALACEMIKIASDVGEPDDPFAAWESVSLIKSQHGQMRKALGNIADMQHAEDADLDDAILIASKRHEAVENSDV